MGGFTYTTVNRNTGDLITEAIVDGWETALGQASTASRAAVYGVPSTDGGTTDDAPALQAAIDALPTSGGTITLEPRTYYLNTATFEDSGNAHRRVVINGNGATFKLGPGLPTSNWSRDTTTRFAFFPNTNRAALSGGSVTVSDANRSTGSGGALRTLVIRDVTVDCQASNRGLVYANRTATTLENVTLYRGRVGLTWWDYTDANSIINCYSRGGSGPAEQVMVEQHQQGDGLTVIGGKADSSVGFLRLKTCRGGTIDGVVTGSIELEQCTGVVITGGHEEYQQSTATALTIKNSHVLLQGTAVYVNWSSTVCPIVIDDSADTETDSELILRDCIAMQLHDTSSGTTAFSPLVNITNVRDNTRIIAQNLKGGLASNAMAGKWSESVQPWITGPAAVISAFDTAAGRANLASGNFTLRRLASTSSWTVDTLTPGITAVSVRHSAAPAIVQTSASSGVNSGGTLTNGTTYAYAVAVLDALGNYSTASAESTIAATSNGTVRLLIGTANSPAVAVIWRKTASGVLTAPDRYCIVPLRAARSYLYDTGGYLSGRAWVTTSVPVPNTVAATNNTADALVVGATTIT